MSTALSVEEYSRRQKFITDLKTMSRSEHVEVARILKKNGVALSENRSGLFVDLSKLSDSVFDELLQFQAFVNHRLPIERKAEA